MLAEHGLERARRVARRVSELEAALFQIGSVSDVVDQVLAGLRGWHGTHTTSGRSAEELAELYPEFLRMR